jgi:chemotaxis protein CheD
VNARCTLVRVGRHAVGSAGDHLIAVGLGSCIAVILHDADAGVGGMAHILLPEATSSSDSSNPYKYAASAIPNLIRSIQEGGRSARGLEARLVGGASMFTALMARAVISMGERNLRASRDALRLAGIPVRGEDVGGEYGRTVRFDVESGIVTVSSVNRADVIL